jgi:hypothetical protein
VFPDTVLTAHAQLVTWRLNCQRAMVSLIDRDVQYFVAESTKTLHLDDRYAPLTSYNIYSTVVTSIQSHGLHGNSVDVHECYRSDLVLTRETQQLHAFELARVLSEHDVCQMNCFDASSTWMLVIVVYVWSY